MDSFCKSSVKTFRAKSIWFS